MEYLGFYIGVIVVFIAISWGVRVLLSQRVSDKVESQERGEE